MSASKPPVTDNAWHTLRQFTAARIALGRAGVSQPTAPQLAFQLAHAQARDAVHLALDGAALQAALSEQLGLSSVLLHSAAVDRGMYLQRPDLGRKLDTASTTALQALPTSVAADGAPCDLAFVIADGLSALAIEQNTVPFLRVLIDQFTRQNGSGDAPWRIAPVAIVAQGRVAVGDEVGALLGARAVVVLIGERPGLSSPDSMGLYLTWQPRGGLTDASRNCISNVRPAGLDYATAAHKLHYLLSQARRRGLSGVELKDETAEQQLTDGTRLQFLL